MDIFFEESFIDIRIKCWAIHLEIVKVNSFFIKQHTQSLLAEIKICLHLNLYLKLHYKITKKLFFIKETSLSKKSFYICTVFQMKHSLFAHILCRTSTSKEFFEQFKYLVCSVRTSVDFSIRYLRLC